MAKSSVTQLAKKKRGPGRPPKTTQTKTETVKKTTPDPMEVARQKAEKLMNDLELTETTKKEEVVETKKAEVEEVDNNSIEWLQEQLELLSNENEVLKVELKKLSQSTNQGDSMVKNNVIKYFTDYLKYRKTQSTDVVITHSNYVAKMVKLFPFLREYVR